MTEEKVNYENATKLTDTEVNKRSKNFDERPHRRGGFFTGAM